ncbi:MAG: response regulator [Candidatus Falkowbacteria bacterium]
MNKTGLIGTPYQRILVIEDEFTNQYLFELNLKDSGIEDIKAFNLREGKELFDKFDGDFDFVLVDACLESKQPDSMELIAYIKDSGFAGEIVAISSNDDRNDLLIAAGATLKFLKTETGKMLKNYRCYHKIIKG